MREIKFRVFNGIEMVTDVIVGKFGAFYVNPGDNGDGLDPKDKASLTPFTTKYHENTIVMQYTGVKDKNEKEIFEGDIIKTSVSLGVVEFDKGLFGINWDWETERKSMLGSWGNETNLRQMYDGFNRTCEVIGNIYEHPHLLSPQVKTRLKEN